MARIAIVDDSASIREILASFLAEEGYEPVIPQGPDPLVAQLVTLQPDLVLLDAHLGPWGDGLAIAAQLRSDPQLAHISLIMMSGASDLLARRALDLTTLQCDVIEKPFDLEDVLACITDALAEAAPQSTPAHPAA